MTPLRRGALPSPAGWTATAEYCEGEGYVYNDGKCNCDSGFSPVEYDGKKLCKQDKQLTNCRGVEVAEGVAGAPTCYTNANDLSTMQTLYDGCVSGFSYSTFDTNPAAVLTACINEGHGPTLNILHDKMFEDACKKIDGYASGSNAYSGNYYCTYCNAANMEPNAQAKCVCKTGYTDADDDITNGCEAEQ